MAGNDFYNALFHVMWDMEVDIFSEPEKTCALVLDLAPKCRKECRRLLAMYQSDAMDFVEMAVSKPDKAQSYLKKAVKSLMDYSDIDLENAVKAVNCVAELWDTFSPLKNTKNLFRENSNGGKLVISDDDDDVESEYEGYDETGGDDMLFVEATEEETVEEEEADLEEEDGGEPKVPIIKKIALYWCKGDDEDDRPRMFTCPIGWIMIILSALLGIFMITDITVGDKLFVPVFVFMFVLLTSKRLYSYDSSARYGILISAFYLIAMLRNIFEKGHTMSYLCVPLVIFSVIVFNNGRISSWLDESKMKPVPAYLFIGLISAVVTLGAFAIQNFVEL